MMRKAETLAFTFITKTQAKTPAKRIVAVDAVLELMDECMTEKQANYHDEHTLDRATLRAYRRWLKRAFRTVH